MSINPDEIIKQCTEVIERIISDDSVPKNIRRSADEIRTILLKEEDSQSIRAALSIRILDDISTDQNLPLHTRTLIWNLAGQLETIPVSD
ncbi:MAG: hypothetical protein GQ469_07620 [Methanosarcinales archaeon]|jgi:uncharacterized protein|nr:hypothetical protein [Methanosarcinales archaeon]